VLDARASRRSNIYPGEPKSPPYHPVGIDGVNCPKDALVKTTGHAVFYRVGADIIRIPEEILERCDSGELFCDLSGCITAKYFFIAVTTMSGIRTTSPASNVHLVSWSGSPLPVEAGGAVPLVGIDRGFLLCQPTTNGYLSLEPRRLDSI
jgi:hypothetical protein